MEQNKLFGIIAGVVGGVAAVAVVMNWSKVNRTVKKTKDESLRRLKATIDHIHIGPHTVSDKPVKRKTVKPVKEEVPVVTVETKVEPMVQAPDLTANVNENKEGALV